MADRLARWLGELGLVEYLEEAGLLRLMRGHDGAAHWSRPATGEPMGEGELADLERQLRSHGEDPAHGVPVALLQAARLARVRRTLLDSAWFTYDSLADARGATEQATRFAVTRAVNERRLLAVPTDLATLIPAFQLDAAAEPRADLADVLDPLLAHRADPWRIWGWLTQPAGLLSGEIPEQVAADPARHGEAVTAARLVAGRLPR